MKVYTTGQIAKYCDVASRTVCKWFDTGKLGGYRIPGSQDRRIPRSSFINFLGDYDLPIADELFYEIAVVSQDDCVIKPLEQLIREFSKCYRLKVAATAFEAGMKISVPLLWCLVLDFDVGPEAREVYEHILMVRKDKHFNLVQAGSSGARIQQGEEVPDYFRKPFDPELLVLRVRRFLLDD